MTGNQIGDIIVFGLAIIVLAIIVIAAIFGPDA